MARNSENLTAAERKFIERNAPEAVQRFASERTGDLGVRVSAYRKLASAARAERDAITEVHLLRVVELGGDPTRMARQARAERDALQVDNRRLAAKVSELAAKPALAVHSED